jgi:hypothetical protein
LPHGIHLFTATLRVLSDYNPVSILPASPQPRIGPYDYWAIEYAYKPICDDEKAELNKIAARSPEKDLASATDEDLWMSNTAAIKLRANRPTMSISVAAGSGTPTLASAAAPPLADWPKWTRQLLKLSSVLRPSGLFHLTM